jgi:hypothetical protein
MFMPLSCLVRHERYVAVPSATVHTTGQTSKTPGGAGRILAAVVSLALSSVACSHTATLDRGAVSVHFESPGTLTGAQVQRDTADEGGFRFAVESSVFTYYVEPPFASVQAVVAVSPADDRVTWSSGPDALRDAMATVLRQGPLKLPDATCEEPTVDTALGRNALEARCKARAEGVTYAMRLRVVATAHSLVCQFASWTDEKSKTLADRFWGTLKPAGATTWSADASRAAPVPVKLLASRLAAIEKG